ncbi:unnamed protein product [Ilex paraguariensis]|uniref:Uncharacterized protein n=1 Tax=Ilex paraguariensis TaxID=185542 RepID=A0ABC8R3H9_9AQUA
MLHTEPSFSIYNSQDGFEGNEKEELVESDGYLKRSVTIGDSIEAIGSGEFSFGTKGMGLIQEDDNEEKEEEETLNAVGGGGDLSPASFDESGNLEEYYERMVRKDPSNPLFLRNYAQICLSKGDLIGAEECYFRATLADPQDGEILMQYAKLVWEFHHDQNKALSYFERATQAAPKDSIVLAAYASFLWNIEDEEEEDCAQNDHTWNKGDEGQVELQKPFEVEKAPANPPLHLAMGLGIEVPGIDTINYAATSTGGIGDVEEYYKRMVNENPCNPLFLRIYAQFLLQSAGDLQGAEKFFSHAILIDPGHGETIAEYAKLVWQLHHDRDRAVSYFEQAVQATPGDSHVLAAYAKFLWDTNEDNDEEINTQITIYT